MGLPLGLPPQCRDGCGETGAWYLNLEASKGLWAVLLGSVSCWPSLSRWTLVKAVVPEQEEERWRERRRQTNAESGRQEERQQWGWGGGTDTELQRSRKRDGNREVTGDRCMGEKLGGKQRERKFSC